MSNDYDPIISPGAAKLTLLEGSTLTENQYGTDVLTRTYSAPTDTIRKLAPKRGAPDTAYPALHVTTRVFTERRGRMSEVAVTFKGLMEGQLGKPKMTQGTTEETTALTVGIFVPQIELLIAKTFGRTFDQLVIGENGVTLQNPGQPPPPPVGFTQDQVTEGDVDVTYRAPYADYYYILKHRPKKPRFGTRLWMEDSALTITDIRPASHRGVLIMKRVIRNVEFRVEKAGKHYEVYERTQASLASRTLEFHSGVGYFGLGYGEHFAAER